MQLNVTYPCGCVLTGNADDFGPRKRQVPMHCGMHGAPQKPNGVVSYPDAPAPETVEAEGDATDAA